MDVSWDVFATVVYSAPAARELELWRLPNGRQLRCVAAYMPTGIDLRPKIWGSYVDEVEAFRPKLLGTRRGA